MNFLEFNDLTFSYPPVENDKDENGNQIVPPVIFEHFSAGFPGGCFLSLVGQNGCGKSTFLLLASGRLAPSAGSVTLLGKNPFFLNQEDKNLLASVIYQNVEFEDDEKTGVLLEHVFNNGALKGSASGILEESKKTGKSLLQETIQVFELEKFLDRSILHLSKGELQRTVLAFSLLYGSPAVFMDEPMFAMEESQKEKSLSYLKEFVKKTGTTIYCAMHELDLTKKYADLVLLFYPDRDMSLGTPDEVLTPKDLERAYNIPAAMLKEKESLNREQLRQIALQYGNHPLESD